MDSPHVTLKVWDLGVRVFHWLLVALVTALWFTATSDGDWMTVHQWLGVTVIAIVFTRMVWGFVGSETARFSSFLVGPKSVGRYLKRFISSGDDVAFVGHNPAGGWSVMLLLSFLVFQALTGLFSNDDIFFDGPLAGVVGKDLSDLITGLHHQLFEILMILIGVHVAAVIVHWVFKRDNLIRPMVSGVKKFKSDTTAPSLQPAWKAFFIGGVSLAIAAVVLLSLE
ncbi:MAG: cytochrome b/b6 domain-containing protein [Arenicellales bacterium]|nr:cytochrome b/b6 domain-containing protein [Arenicellales bacterium]